MIEEWLFANKIPFERNVPLKSRTWIKRGGVAAYWIVPQTTGQLAGLAAYFYRSSLAFEVVGSTSNLYFRNDYNPLYVISTVGLNHYRIEDKIISCDPGVLISRLAVNCIELGIAGYEGFHGLPGTVGGAVYNNSSCFACEVSTLLDSVTIITSDGGIKEVSCEEMEYSHRNSILKNKKLQGVILQVNFRRDKTEAVEVLKAKSKNNRLYRRTRQEGYIRNLGSTYAVLDSPRWNIRYLLSFILIKCMLLIEKEPSRIRRKRKMIFLWVYNSMKLKEYISDHNLNCFVWKDEKADELFDMYNAFLSKIYNTTKLEIEIKENR